MATTSASSARPAASRGPLHLIQAEVAHGRKLGRKLGFPTANLPLDGAGGQLDFGVYAARAVLPDGRRVDGVASAGVNPSVGVVDPVLEMFIFDFAEDLYGKLLAVELWAFIREERNFDSLGALTAQIGRDVAAARELLSTDGDGRDHGAPSPVPGRAEASPG